MITINLIPTARDLKKKFEMNFKKKLLLFKTKFMKTK